MLRINCLGLTVRLYVIVCCAFLITVANAEEYIELPTIVTLSATYDSDDGQDYYFDANIGLPSRQRIILSIGKLKIPTSDSDQQLEPINALIGFSSDPSVSFPLGVELEYWEEDTDTKISVNTLRGSVGYNSESISLEFIPQIRQFKFDVDRIVAQEFSSEGFTIGAGVTGVEDMIFSINYSKHYYSELLLEIARRFLPQNFTRIKLINSVGFEDNIIMVDGSYYLDWGELGGYWFRSESAIDSAITYAYGLFTGLYMLDDWSLDFSLGTQATDGVESQFYYGTLGLSYYY